MRRSQVTTARETKPSTGLAPEALTPEVEIAHLTETRAGLAAQLVPLEQAKAAATLSRRNLLLSGTADEAATTEANRICRERESDWYAIADAITEADRRLADAIERRDAEAIEAERQRIAGALERNATEIETVAASLVKAIGEVAKQHALLHLTVTRRAAGQFDPNTGAANTAGVANAILLQGLVHAMPDLKVIGDLKPWFLHSAEEQIEGADPSEVVSDFVVRLRETASKVRSQQIGHDLPMYQEAMPPYRPDNSETEIFVLEPFYYQNLDGHRTMVSTPHSQVLMLVAERAIEMGVATDEPTAEWRNKHRNKDRGSIQSAGSSVLWEQCTDLGLDLSAIRNAEVKRLEAEWLEREAQAAA